MPITDALIEQRDERFYAGLRSFAARKRRTGKENGRKPRQPRSLDELPPPPTDDELARWQATQK